MAISDQFESGSASWPAYLTVDQVAEMLRVNRRTIIRWAAGAPTMPVLRMRRVVRFPRERLLRWRGNREQGRGRSRALPAT
jgi:excisionase family DNA binding protein